MSKVICDICGTSYPETADRCPICGYAKELNGDNILGLNEQVENAEAVAEEEIEPKEGLFAGAKSYDQSRNDDDDDYDDYDDDEDEEEDEEPRSNTFLIVILVILIVALLAVTGFIYVKYFMPNTDKPAETTVPTTQVETTLPEETTEPRIPCTGLTMTSEGNVILEQAGHSWLINVSPLPADTTDKILYSSSDESVVTVNDTGTLTAVGQGEAVITVTCGDQMLTCNVTCFFIEETTAPTGTTAPAEFEGEDETTAPVEETTAPTEAATEPEETEAPTEPEDEKTDGEVTLTLKRTDLSFGMLGAVYTLEIEEDIDPSDVKWTSANGNIVIVHDGILRTTGKGVTKIYAEYKGAKAECVIRVSY